MKAPNLGRDRIEIEELLGRAIMSQKYKYNKIVSCVRLKEILENEEEILVRIMRRLRAKISLRKDQRSISNNPKIELFQG
jgi:hypothetical protein